MAATLATGDVMHGKVIAITGGFGVLGRAVAAAALDAGARVVAIDRAPPPASVDGGVIQLGGVDLADLAAAVAAVDAARERFGRLDGLINVVGGFRWQTLAEGDFKVWSDLFALNVLTVATACRAALPHLAASGHGAIVNVGANAAVRAAAGMGAYAAAKSGVHRLTESLAEEWKGRVRVNAILPSILDTPTNRAEMPDADFSAWVSPEEAAAAILFLASDSASAITGALLPVTGRT